MASLIQLGKYGDINAADPTKMVCYVVKVLSEPYTLQEYKITDVQVSKASELVVKLECLSLMR